MAPIRTVRNILMELRKVCQHPYLSAPELEDENSSISAQHKALTEASGKLNFLKLLLPKLKERGHRVLLFSQFKIALNIIEDWLVGEGYKFLRLDGDIQQAQRQKSMDAFNAPGSEYFIFLLTTRAGGVGINLATADTVIVYDPDFNPHQDLQAIARAHRYGQKKPTLVFKLMTKNSVEEQIVLNGKKKMVLDHLVVQQMGKESEEGDIDNMLLHGAAALYETSVDGVAASDIRYTLKDVDELIDKVEGDAEAEAKALEERDKLKEQGAVTPTDAEGAPKPKESMSFGFAKIWEADQNRIHDMSDDEDEEDRQDDDADAWAQAYERMEQERKAKLLADSGQRLRQRQNGNKQQYKVLPLDGLGSDDQSDGKSGQANQDKGKGKVIHSDISDAEWAMNPEDDSESEDDMPALVADALDVFDIVDGQAVPKLRNVVLSSEEAIRRAKERDALQQAIKNGTVPASAAIAAQTKEERQAAKQARREAKSARRAQKQAQVEAASSRTATRLALNGRTSSKASSSMSVPQIPVPKLTPQAIQSAQHVIQWLYHVLLNLGLKKDLSEWALMALPELPGNRRMQIYLTLSTKADDAMSSRGQNRYFNLPSTRMLVHPLLISGGAVMPDFQDPSECAVPPVPENLGRMRYDDVNVPKAVRRAQIPSASNPVVSQPQPQPQFEHPTAPAPAPVPAKQYKQHLPSPYTSPQPGHIAAPAARSPALPMSSSNTAPNGIMNPFSGSPFDGLQPISEAVRHDPSPMAVGSAYPLAGLDRPVQNQACGRCNGHHEPGKCLAPPVLDQLKRRLQVSIAEDEKTGKKSFLTSHYEALIAQLQGPTASGAKEANQGAHTAKNGSTIPTTNGHVVPATDTSKTSSRTPRRLDQEVIVIEDDSDKEEDTARPAKRAKSSANGTAASTSDASHTTCPICEAKTFHIANACPVVTAGAESIKNALKRFTPGDPTWRLLKTMYDQTVPDKQSISTPKHACAFCSKICGKTIRQCATDMHHGASTGRRALKARIREVEAEGEKGKEVKDLADELYEVYLKWEK